MAIEKGDERTVRRTLRRGTPVDLRDEDGLTLLMPAASAGQRAICSILLASGAAVNAVDSYGCTPLHRAVICRSTEPELVALLLTAGARLEPRNSNGSTPLRMAAQCDNYEAVKALLAAGAKVDTPDNKGVTGLHWAADKVFIARRSC